MQPGWMQALVYLTDVALTGDGDVVNLVEGARLDQPKFLIDALTHYASARAHWIGERLKAKGPK